MSVLGTRSGRDNSFDLIRVGLAVVVLFSHSFPLTLSREPLFGLLGTSIGTIALVSFFGISGYLISSSWFHDQRWWAFATRRGLRIMPALIVSALVTAFILGPVVTTLPLHAYLDNAGTYIYVVKQSVLDTLSPRLPHVFLNNRYSHLVNGSTWTIPLEVICYAALLIAGVTGLLRRGRWLAGMLLIVCLLLIVGPRLDFANERSPHGVAQVLSFLRLGGAFLTGSLLWECRDRIPLSPIVLAVAIVLVLLPLPHGMRTVTEVLFVPLAAVTLGSLRPGRLAVGTRPGDLSYGMYIYGYPIQQTIVHFIKDISPGAMFAISAPASWGVALLSWRLVERRALALKSRIPARSVPVRDDMPPEADRHFVAT